MKPNLIRRRCSRGYSLVEVLISILIISYIGIVFTASFPVAKRGSRVVGNYAQAISIAQHKIDQLRAIGYGRLNYTELRSASAIDVSPTSSPYKFTTVDNLSQYFPNPEGTITVTFLSSTVAQATVELSWAGAKHTGGTLRLDVLITKG
jgi:type II secretory pathway pseudopilin PulG